MLAMIGAALVYMLLFRTGAPPASPPSGRQAEALARLPGRPDETLSASTSEIPPSEALARNNAVPFVSGKIIPARSFAFTGTSLDRQRAIECLALAAMAEAGGSDEGQRAVIQVILNRVRHPAFAKTICGVVFQGSERATGCQFTFTCDGSIARQYSAAAWAVSRKRAMQALDGKVFAPVGTSTHYHTNWVYPYWSPSLDKVAQVETHLFFRWKGFWGTTAAARLPYRGGEPDPAILMGKAATLPGPGATEAVDPQAPGGSLTAGIGGAEVVIKHPDGGAFLVLLAARTTAADALMLSRRLCGGTGYCRVMGWNERSVIPKGFPIPPAARAKLRFNYVIDDRNEEIVLYDCALFKIANRDQCIPPPLKTQQPPLQPA